MPRTTSETVAKVIGRLQAKYPSMNRETLTGITRNVMASMRGERVDANRPNTQVKRGVRTEAQRRREERGRR